MALYYFDASALAEYDLTEPGNAWYAKSFSCIQIDKLLTMVILFLMDNPSCYLLEIHELLRSNEGENSIALGEEEAHGRHHYSDVLSV
jgi:hypothetical protein